MGCILITIVQSNNELYSRYAVIHKTRKQPRLLRDAIPSSLLMNATTGRIEIKNYQIRHYLSFMFLTILHYSLA